jgi:hypothetical protein
VFSFHAIENRFPLFEHANKPSVPFAFNLGLASGVLYFTLTLKCKSLWYVVLGNPESWLYIPFSLPERNPLNLQRKIVANKTANIFHIKPNFLKKT